MFAGIAVGAAGAGATAAAVAGDVSLRAGIAVAATRPRGLPAGTPIPGDVGIAAAVMVAAAGAPVALAAVSGGVTGIAVGAAALGSSLAADQSERAGRDKSAGDQGKEIPTT